jgi:hypothetical protein
MSSALPQTFVDKLTRTLVDLHDRALLNENALLVVLIELLNGVPLSRDHLVAIFGVSAIDAIVVRSPHRSARLAEIQDEILRAHEIDDLAVKVLMPLTNLLADEWGLRESPIYRQLVGEAYEAFLNPEARIDLRDWMKRAAPFLSR